MTARAAFPPATDEVERSLLQLRMATYNVDPYTLADKCRCSLSTIYSFRSGRTRWPRDRTLFALCRALNFEIIIRRKG